MTLPIEDVYELQIVEVNYRKNVPQYKQPDVLKDEIVFVCDLLGTENPNYEDKPWRVWIWGVRDGKLTYKKADKLEASYAGKFLMALGYDRGTLDGYAFKDLDWQACDGLYLRGAVSHKPDGKNLSCKPDNLMQVKNAEHKTRNLSRKDDIFQANAVKTEAAPA
jgi:hypothetical protein